MKTKFNLKKAFTLLELSIVIALVAIVGTVTTSLCLLVSKTANKNSNQLAFMQDISSIQSALETYTSYDVSCNRILENRTNGQTTVNYLLSEDEHYNPAHFDAQTKELTINYTTITLTTIENISFTVLKEQNDFLIICKVTANGNFANDGSNTFVFAINPFVLESVNINNGGANNG